MQLWGADDRVYDALIPTWFSMNAIRDLPRTAPEGVTFTGAEVSDILGRNAARLFGL